MDKKELRRSIREQKRAMSEAEICERSAKLGQLFAASDAYKNAKTISLIIGSEGGFSLKEVELAKGKGAKIAGLGKRILRCETAPSFALACIAYETEL